MVKTRLINKYFYFPAIVLFVYFIIRLINQSQLMFIFPLDHTNDWASHIAQLYFLAKVGFHNLNFYWYNGYILFKFYPPGWFFFTLPIYLLTKNILFSTYFSVLSLFTISFLFVNYFLKKLNLSLIKRIFFYIIFFANPISIGNFIRLGKVTELMAWTFFLPLGLIILIYKNKPLTFRTLLMFSLFSSILIISHPTVLLAFLLLAFSLFLIKNIKERIFLIASLIFSFILSSFWSIPFLKDLLKSSTLEHVRTFALLNFSGQWLKTTIATITMVIAFLVVFIFYIRQVQNKKRELIFFSPLLVVSLLVLSKLIIFIPFLRSVYPDVYSLLFLFVSLFLIFKTKYTFTIKKMIFYSLILFSLGFIVLSSMLTPWFTKYTALENQTLSLLPDLDDKFIILPEGTVVSRTSFPKAYYSYIPIYYNISTSEGYSWHEINKEYLDMLGQVYPSFENQNCFKLKNCLKNLNTTNVISYFEDCEFLKKCKLKEISSTKDVCLMKVSS